MRKAESWYALLGFGVTVAAAGWFGARHSPRQRRAKLWYQRLKKPAYSPPSYVFPFVWTALYSLIAVSGWQVWEAKASPERTRALTLWAAQLAANAAWTEIFFGEHQPKLALADIVAMEAMIVAYILNAKEVDRTAAACFLPYAAWVAFAALLNEEIVRMNPDAERLFPRPA